MIYFLKIFGILLALAGTVTLTGATLAVPLVLLARLEKPWAFAAFPFGVVWFCAFAAILIAIDTWDER